MLVALLFALTWDPAPLGVDLVEATAFTRAPVVLPCPEPDTGDCIVSYLETWREVQVLPATATGASWSAELPSRAVSYMSVRFGRSVDNDGICWGQ